MFDNIEIIDEFAWAITENNASTLLTFPNPASTEIQIQNLNTEIKTIKIYSMDGRLVFSQRNPYQTKINVEFLDKGTYQILLETADGKFLTNRFIKL